MVNRHRIAKDMRSLVAVQTINPTTNQKMADSKINKPVVSYQSIYLPSY